MRATTFNPIKDGKPLKPEQYIEAYPELAERDETKSLRAIEIMWCWFYACKDSPYERLKHNDKCKEVTHIVFSVINKNYYEKSQIGLLKDGIVPHDWRNAIEFFRKVNTELRSDAKSMFIKMYEQYKEIVEGGYESFKKEDGEIDYAKYVATMKMIKNEMSELINNIERGFGSSIFSQSATGVSEGQYYCELYIKNKR